MLSWKKCLSCCRTAVSDKQLGDAALPHIYVFVPQSTAAGYFIKIAWKALYHFGVNASKAEEGGQPRNCRDLLFQIIPV